MNEFEMYESGLSIPQISDMTNIAKSTLRFRFNRKGILRSRKEALIICAKSGRLSSGKGKKRVFSEEWKNNISKAKLRAGNITAKGLSIKPSGYIEITKGENKGRLQHVVIMENFIKRKLCLQECVHHINGIKTDNRIENLQLMTRKEHMKLHGEVNIKKRLRNSKGQLI